MTRLGLIILLLSVATVTGWAHAFLDHAEPGVGSQVKTSPSQVRFGSRKSWSPPSAAFRSLTSPEKKSTATIAG
jgi:methionine-rich copper-binding protein CopC